MRTFSYEPPYLAQDSGEVGDLDFLFCRIAGNTWRYTLVTSDQMEKIHHKGDAACPGLTSCANQVIYIKDIEHTVIIHELVHAFKDSCATGTASLTDEQSEELFAEIFAYNWWKILRLANQIHYNLKLLAEVHAGADPKSLLWSMLLPDGVPQNLAEELAELVASYDENGRNIFAERVPVFVPSKMKTAKKKPRRASRS